MINGNGAPGTKCRRAVAVDHKRISQKKGSRASRPDYPKPTSK